VRLRQVRDGEARRVAGGKGEEIRAVLEGGHASVVLQWAFRAAGVTSAARRRPQSRHD